MIIHQKPWANDARLARAQAHLQRGEALQAELLLRELLREHADCVPAARTLARLASERDDLATAISMLELARAHDSQDPQLALELAQVQAQQGQPEQAQALLAQVLGQDPEQHVAWLMLGAVREQAGDAMGALRARYQGITRAQKAGLWLNPQTTPQHQVQMIMHQMQVFRQQQLGTLLDALESPKAKHGAAALKRVEHAVMAHLGQAQATPPDPRQKPKFFYFPDLPVGPWHEPKLHPWVEGLQQAWPEMRREALELLAHDRDFVDFMGLKPGDDKSAYIGGSNAQAAWDAFFFYRHGKRLDENHAKCPNTSQALEAAQLCRIDNQAPEICFSLLRPQSTIVAHYGVTNVRLVLHVPLVVPGNCALHLIGAGEHAWQEGRCLLFDDTFQHEAWNRSNRPRVVLLMDCWNPHLSLAEQEGVKAVIQAIDSVENGPAFGIA